MIPVSNLWRSVGPALNLKLNEKIVELKKAGEHVYHLGFGQSPFPVPKKALKSLRDHADKNGYLPTAGLIELRKEISKFHSLYEDVEIDPSDIVVGPGSKPLIFTLLHLFDGCIMIPSPCWTTYGSQIRASGKRPVLVDTNDRWKITPDSLEKACIQARAGDSSTRLLLIFCNPDNPSGSCYSKSELEELGEVIKKNDIVCLSDEIYARLHYRDAFYPMAKIGYMILPSSMHYLLPSLLSIGSHTYSCAPAPIQYAAIDLLQDPGACENYIKHSSRILGKCAEFCVRELTSVGVEACPPEAGYYLIADFEVIRPQLNTLGINTGVAMCDKIFEEIRVVLMAAGPGFLRPENELTTRLCFVNFDGAHALKMSREVGLETPLPDSFVKEHCTELYESIITVKNWVEKMKKLSA